MASAVVVVDKPQGRTSHDVVAGLRKKLGTRRIGHAGTLDPMATGVLVVATGEATKLVPWLTATSKEYEAVVALGRATDTLDADGRETARITPPADWHARLPEAIAAELGRTEQEPPAFSAIHADGERAHVRARRGETPVLAARPVSVESLVVTSTGELDVRLRLVVSKGYYVRALARDLAARLGTVGCLTELRRTRSGPFTLADVGVELSLETAATRVLPAVTLTETGAAHARAGRRVPACEMSATPSGPQAWLAPDGKLVAVGTVEDGGGRVIRGFA